MNNTWNENVINNVNTEILNKNIGKKITLEGKSVNAKLGALLVLKNGQQIWIEDLKNWPKNYYTENENSKTLKVIGVLIEKNDLPVFEENNDSTKITQQGIPLPKGTSLKQVSHRYLLKNAEWKIINE